LASQIKKGTTMSSGQYGFYGKTGVFNNDGFFNEGQRVPIKPCSCGGNVQIYCEYEEMIGWKGTDFQIVCRNCKRQTKIGIDFALLIDNWNDDDVLPKEKHHAWSLPNSP